MRGCCSSFRLFLGGVIGLVVISGSFWQFLRWLFLTTIVDVVHVFILGLQSGTLITILFLLLIDASWRVYKLRLVLVESLCLCSLGDCYLVLYSCSCVNLGLTRCVCCNHVVDDIWILPISFRYDLCIIRLLRSCHC